MSLEILEAKEAIREVIDRFSNLECDVHAQMPFFTEDTHVMVYMGGNLAMDIHGREELEKTFSGFTSGIKSSHHMNGQQVITVTGDTAVDGTLLPRRARHGRGWPRHRVRQLYPVPRYARPSGWRVADRGADSAFRYHEEAGVGISRFSPRDSVSPSAHFFFREPRLSSICSLTKSRQENLFRRYARIGTRIELVMYSAEFT